MRIDVVIPCYNYAHYLEGCVKSVLQQGGVEIRVLIIDDASKDDSQRVGLELAKADDRVSYLRNEKNLGLVGTANRGVMEWAEAEYTLLLSADDALTTGALWRAAHALEQVPEAGMAFGLARVFETNAELSEPLEVRDVRYVVVEGDRFVEQACTSWCGVASPTALVRTSVQHEVGGLDPRFPHTCDMEIWLRIARVSSIVALNSVQAFYRRHTSNMSTGFTRKPLSDIELQFETVLAVLEKFPPDSPTRGEWLHKLTTRLTHQAYWFAGLALERGDVAGMKECLTFARRVEHYPEALVDRVRFEMKRLLGQRALEIGRSLLKKEEPKGYDPFTPGELFGWRPVGTENELQPSQP